VRGEDTSLTRLRARTNPASTKWASPPGTRCCRTVRAKRSEASAFPLPACGERRTHQGRGIAESPLIRRASRVGLPPHGGERRRPPGLPRSRLHGPRHRGCAVSRRGRSHGPALRARQAGDAGRVAGDSGRSRRALSSRRDDLSVVMPGLDPDIHAFEARTKSLRPDGLLKAPVMA
jgi:hypothetical protein